MKNENELLRISKMSVFEKETHDEGLKFVAGVDEVGRGSLAGPVIACALILPQGCIIESVNDSKKLTPKKRKELFKIILDNVIDCAVGEVDYKTIDEINILRASNRAMAEAVEKLKVVPDCILVDGYRVPEIKGYQKSIIRGDEKSITIAAASIVAKVIRDEMMCDYHMDYPQYNFDRNKGYGTKAHIEAIRKFGLSDIHRKSFTRKILQRF